MDADTWGKLYNLDMQNSKKNKVNPPNLNHLAIIMDGNGRWAKSKGLPRLKGHQEGAKRVLEIAKEAKAMNIPYLSLFAFSTENWSRPEREVNGLFRLLNEFVNKYLKTLHKDQVRLVISGWIEGLPVPTQKLLKRAILETKDYHRYTLNICVNYGGQDEIVRATQRAIKAVQLKVINIEDITPVNFYQFLDTANLPPVDCLVRTSGEHRISNFLLYQIAYAELVFVAKSWPDFKATDLQSVIQTYQERQRRFGNV
jgi:undecaprenyl diphosphate synthase